MCDDDDNIIDRYKKMPRPKKYHYRHQRFAFVFIIMNAKFKIIPTVDRTVNILFIIHNALGILFYMHAMDVRTFATKQRFRFLIISHSNYYCCFCFYWWWRPNDFRFKFRDFTFLFAKLFKLSGSLLTVCERFYSSLYHLQYFSFGWTWVPLYIPRNLK